MLIEKASDQLWMNTPSDIEKLILFYLFSISFYAWIKIESKMLRPTLNGVDYAIFIKSWSTTLPFQSR